MIRVRASQALERFRVLDLSRVLAGPWASQILGDLGLSTIRILTNNPKKVSGIRRYGLKILRRIPLEIPPTKSNHDYLKVKKDKLGHLLSKVQ